MIRRNSQRLKEVLDELIKSQHLDGRLYEKHLIDAFPGIAGTGIAAHMTNIYIQKGILYISFDSSVIRNEMQLMRTRLISRLNDAVGHETIHEIVFR